MDANYLKSELSNQELMLVNSEVEKNSKNAVVAYLLWWFTGFMGGHRYYFGKTGSAIAMTLIFWLLIWALGLGALITGIWALVDVFQIHNWINDDKHSQENSAIQQIMLRRQLRNNSNNNNSNINNSTNTTAQNTTVQSQNETANTEIHQSPEDATNLQESPTISEDNSNTK